MLRQRSSANILLALTSLNKDFEAGHRTPTSDTLGLVLEGIRLLKAQLETAHGVSEDSILAVLCLWKYEVKLMMGVAEKSPKTTSAKDQSTSKSWTSNVQVHISGLQRSIKYIGGLQNLSSEAQWLLAW